MIQRTRGQRSFEGKTSSATAELDRPVLDPTPVPERQISTTGRQLVANPIVQDSLIAAVLTATSLVGVFAQVPVDIPEGAADEALRPFDGLGLLLVLLQTVPLVWRRFAPLAVLAVTTMALFLFSYFGYFLSFGSFGFLVALYTVAAHRDRRISIPAGLVAGVVMLSVVLFGREPLEPNELIAQCLIVGAAWFIGDGLRIQRGQVVQLESRATRLERERDEFTQRAVSQERRVIARELHDVVAHNVSVIVAQAGAAQRIADTQPKEAFATLTAIEHAGREALVEMRRLMGFLRKQTDPALTMSPQPGLDDLGVLVAQVQEAGLPVTLTIVGRPRELPAGLDLSAFRIVQEALTNVLKHAGPTCASVLVRYGDSCLELTIDDDGSGPDGWTHPPRPRYGHLGMRERVGLFGGELRVGGRPEGGYRVAALLPLDGEPS